MREIERTWLDVPDDVEREVRARHQLDLALSFIQSEVWQQIASALRSQIDDTLADLARSQKDDEQNRGVIRALNHVLSMPDNLVRAASDELN